MSDNIVGELVKVCEMARLQGDVGDKMPDVQELVKIIDLLNVITQVDVAGVKPMYLATEHLLKEKELRKDVVVQDVSCQEILQNAPEQKEDFFVLPRVIG